MAKTIQCADALEKVSPFQIYVYTYICIYIYLLLMVQNSCDVFEIYVNN